MYALVDCNNFYASCERLFQPQLNNTPIVVLSNNDGCIIARSQEAKKLGVPMGEPYFKAKAIIEAHRMAVFSSNYTLYGDISRRVMATLAQFFPDIEIYSIDEAFIHLRHHLHIKNAMTELRHTIYQWIGMPVSIGIGSTKTLAKLANHIAKTYPAYKGVFIIENDAMRQKVLAATAIGEIWGIGRQIAKRLTKLNVHTALEFTQLPDALIRQCLSVTGLRTAHELRGIESIPFEHVTSPKKMITVSRSFGQKLSQKDAVKEALAHFTARACEKLRHEQQLARHAYIALYQELAPNIKKRFRHGAMVYFPQATNSTLQIMRAVMEQFESLYVPGYTYKKCQITLAGFEDEHSLNASLFEPYEYIKDAPLMTTIDQLNQHYGQHTIIMGNMLGARKWVAKKDRKSPCYTTRWNELACVG